MESRPGVPQGSPPRPLRLQRLPCLCEYALVGRVDLPVTLNELEDRRSAAAANGGRHLGRLRGVEFGPDAVAWFCSDPLGTFTPLALITIVHTVMHEFGVARTEKAFADASVQVSQQLPPWLGWSGPTDQQVEWNRPPTRSVSASRL